MTTWGIFWISFFSFGSFVALCIVVEEINQHLYQRWRVKTLVKYQQEDNEND